ncbi:hypothetical protein [Clostridium carboxidivorans]|nr:hypothetical protein [Clostridium carboxidivorans]
MDLSSNSYLIYIKYKGDFMGEKIKIWTRQDASILDVLENEGRLNMIS